ncbi:neutrophil antibiotic peptide NP-1, partial [Sigmodon hispidus]
VGNTQQKLTTKNEDITSDHFIGPVCPVRVQLCCIPRSGKKSAVSPALHSAQLKDLNPTAMRTLALLTALLLLAIQTQAEPLHGRAEVFLDQVQLEEDVQDVSITFEKDEGKESSALQDADVRSSLTCFCRTGRCVFPERQVGSCRQRNRIYRLCCRR